MRRVSKKRAVALRLYKRKRERFLAAHPVCEFPHGCLMPSEVIHHRRGRSGERLNDERWWAASCWTHNDYAETNTGAALECGWLLRVESVDGVA